MNEIRSAHGERRVHYSPLMSLFAVSTLWLLSLPLVTD